MQARKRSLNPAPRQTWLIAVSCVLILAGCGFFKPAPDTLTPEEIREILLVEPYGPATFSVAENHILFASATEGEGGITLKPSGEVDEPIVVRFSYRDAAPLNLRLAQADGFKYLSAARESHVILGGDYAREALFYAAGPVDLDIRIEAITACGEDNFYCLPDGSAARTFSRGGLKNKVLVDSYNNALLEGIKGKAVTVVRNMADGEYGAALTLAPSTDEQDYILEFETSDPESLNLRVDRYGQMRYYSATRGWARLNSETQLLFFTGTSDAFELRDMKLVDCDASEWRCRTAEDFDDLLPGEPGDVSIERLIALTEWATLNSDYAASGEVAARMNITGLTPSQIYHQYYEPSLGGGFCAATAVFLARTLRSQGFDAFTMDFGIREDNLTHVTTIVAINDDYYLFDATFGAFLAQPGTSIPLSILEVLDGAPYEFRSFDMSGRDFVFSKKDKKMLNRLKGVGAIVDCEPSSQHSIVVCKRPGFGLASYLDSFSQALSKNGLDQSPETLIQLMRTGVFGIGDSQDTDSMQEFAQELARRGIPLPEGAGQPSPQPMLAD